MNCSVIRIPVNVLLFILALLLSTNIYSQFNNTIFWMQDLPQSAQSNIALQPSHRFYLGFPGLSSFYTSISHDGFALNDVVSKDLNKQLYIDSDKVLGSLKDKNNIALSLQHEFLSFGFSRHLNTFSFSATEKIGVNLGYSADLIRLISYGNQHFIDRDRAADFSGTGLDMIHYREFAFGFTRQITDYLVAGMRTKLLFGLANLWTEKSHISFYTDPVTKEITTYANLLANTSGPVGLADSDDNDFNANEYILNTGNRGLALDFGLAYQPFENLTLAFSLIDAGRINWNDGVENIRMQGEIFFDGLDINKLIDGEYDQDILDSLKQELNYTESFNSYRTRLSSGLFFSAAYQLSPKHTVSLLTGSRFHKNHTHRTLSAAYHFHASERFFLTTSYSIIHGNYSNLGLGMNLNLGAIQFYMLSDNILGMMIPQTMQSFNIHFGFNIIIDYQRRNQLLNPHFSFDQIVGFIRKNEGSD